MSNPGNILITGATGTVGKPLALRLAAAASAPAASASGGPRIRVRALVRDPARAAGLAEAGVALVAGAFEDAAKMAAALDQVDTLVLITAAGAGAADLAHAAVEAARAAGVRRIVRLSAIKASADGPTDNTRQHARTEAEIRATGAAFVFLRPVAFYQNLLWSAGEVLSQGTLHQGTGDARVNLIDTRDVVDCLERVALSDELDGQTFELTGPAPVSNAEVAASLARALGRPVRYVPVAPDALGEGMRKLGADEWTARLVRDYATAYGQGWGDFTTDAVQQLSGHPARDLDAFVREVFVPATSAAS